MGDGGFSPEAPGEPAVGPSTNRGQKGGALIDYLTVVISEAQLEERGLTNIDNLLATLFGFRGHEVRSTGWRDKRWQFYPQSSVLVDADGEVVGRMGRNNDNGTQCVSLTGSGTRYVQNWHACQMHLVALRARISRLDLAFDDYEGERFNVHEMRLRARSRDFCQGGTPPKWRFLDDEGCGTGSTLYVGSKGHKELCIYEKGKQLGHLSSPWVRAEVRLYGKHMTVPIESLTDPLAYLKGAYDVLGELLIDIAHDECTRLKTTRRAVAATGEALVAWAHEQVGPTLFVLLQAFGGSFEDFLQHRIVRPGTPGRFRGLPKGEELAQILRKELCHVSS